ncbi:hypothetical protein, partial [Sandarakinorhabdus rubra]|uniref:hypothetical protein n=1 Tax=Sandarakinorhabdus rubra TaxID=2672568 RepID=UPI0013DBBC29
MATRAADAGAPRLKRSGGQLAGSQRAAQGAASPWLARLRAGLAALLRQLARLAAGAGIAVAGLSLALALISYSPLDPSFNTA